MKIFAYLFKIAQRGRSLRVRLTIIHALIFLGGGLMLERAQRILIADDKSSIRISLSAVLAEVGYQVRTAVDGFSALSEIRQEVPDILVSDLHMPGMSGFELLLVIRQRFPAIQVVAMSGAFLGDEVPSGIPADAFYQKGSSVTALFHIFGELSRMSRRAPAPLRKASPLWVQRNGVESPGKAFVKISCPECLRSFPQTLESDSALTHEIECVNCHCSIQFAIVEPSDRMPPQASVSMASSGMATACAPAIST